MQNLKTRLLLNSNVPYAPESNRNIIVFRATSTVIQAALSTGQRSPPIRRECSAPTLYGYDETVSIVGRSREYSGRILKIEIFDRLTFDAGQR